MKQLKQVLADHQTKAVLDVGTGVGNFIGLLKSMEYPFEKIIGIDTSKKAIEIANDHFSEDPGVSFLEMDANQMSFSDESFDVVCLSNSLHHLSDIKHTLSEMERVLKHQGLIIIHEMISEPLSKAQISHKLIHHFSAEIDRYHGMTHGETYTVSEIKEILNEYVKVELVNSWPIEHPETYQFSQQDIDQIIGSIDRMVERMVDSTSYVLFEKKGHEIQDYIRANGFELATEWLFILEKK